MPTRTPYYQFDPYNPYPQLYMPQNQQIPQNMQQAMPQSIQQNVPQQQTAQPPQIQNGGFVSVRSEQEARNYAVAPGTSVTFKDENSPYCYTKTKGFSQLEEPIFEKYRLVKEESVVEEKREDPIQHEEYVSKHDLDTLTNTVNSLSDTVDSIGETVDSLCEEIERLHEKRTRRKEVAQNDD